MGRGVRILIGSNGQTLSPGEPKSCRHEIRTAAVLLVPKFYCRNWRRQTAQQFRPDRVVLVIPRVTRREPLALLPSGS
jgi:hypothetical protein